MSRSLSADNRSTTQPSSKNRLRFRSNLNLKFVWSNLNTLTKRFHQRRLDWYLLTRRLTVVHNDPINRLVEQGLLGFLAWMSLWVSIAYG